MPAQIARVLRGVRGRRTVPAEPRELVLESWFETVHAGTRVPFGEGDAYPVVTGTFLHEFPVTLETRGGVRTFAAIGRGEFSIRPQQRDLLYFGRTGDADLFASEVARGLLDDSQAWGFLDLTRQQLADVRRRAVNIRGVGYRRNPDPYVFRMGYTGSNVDQNAEVRRADRSAELYRITIEITLTSGKRTLQLMNSGNMLGYGAGPADFEDLTDLVDQVLNNAGA